MDPLNRAWTAAGTLHFQRKVIDPATGLEVLISKTQAAIRKWKETYALARRPRRTRTRATSTPYIATACPRLPFRNRVPVAARPRLDRRVDAEAAGDVRAGAAPA